MDGQFNTILANKHFYRGIRKAAKFARESGFLTCFGIFKNPSEDSYGFPQNISINLSIRRENSKFSFLEEANARENLRIHLLNSRTAKATVKTAYTIPFPGYNKTPFVTEENVQQYVPIGYAILYPQQVIHISPRHLMMLEQLEGYRTDKDHPFMIVGTARFRYNNAIPMAVISRDPNYGNIKNILRSAKELSDIASRLIVTPEELMLRAIFDEPLEEPSGSPNGYLYELIKYKTR